MTLRASHDACRVCWNMEGEDNPKSAQALSLAQLEIEAATFTMQLNIAYEEK